jgi:AcrR family transcriptional regulator
MKFQNKRALMRKKQEETAKAEILKSASNCFRKWGLKKTTMEDVAREAGKGKSTLYYYYKSKEEILEELLINEMNDIETKTNNIADNFDSVREKLSRFITVMADEIKKTSCIYPLIRREIKGNKNANEKFYRYMVEKEEMNVTNILKEGLKVGEFNFSNGVDLKKTAKVIIAIFNGLWSSPLFEEKDNEKNKIAAKIIINGI